MLISNFFKAKLRIPAVPTLGDKLLGIKSISSDGSMEFRDYPSYEVAGFHINGKIMFLDVLNRKGEPIRTEQMPINSTQWRYAK